VWLGDINNGNWADLTQLSPFDTVSDGAGEKNKPKPKFRGAIVALGDRKL